MQQETQYEVEGLLKAGTDHNDQPVYIMLENLITQNKNEEAVTHKLSQYLQQYRPFKGFIVIICSQEDAQLTAKNVKKLIKKIILKIQSQQLKRFEKLIVICSNQNYGKHEETIPFMSKSQFKDKLYVINNTSFLDQHQIELHKSVLKFLCNPIQFQLQQTFYGIQLDDYPIGKSGIPIFLEEIIKYYINNTNALRNEGIFRLSGSRDQEIKLIDEILKSNYEAIKSSSPDVVATVLKNSLINLKQPIFPYEIYDILKDISPSISRDEFINMFSIFIAHLPKVNKAIVFQLIQFIKVVSEYQKFNKMDLHNLAIVFTPCFFRASNNTELDIQGAKKVVLHFEQLIQNIESFMEIQKKISL